MKDRKRRVEYISFYNHTGLEKHFARMAKKGWLIEKISSYYWTYRKIQPQDIHFCVTYYPRASEFDPEPSEAQQTFHDFCAHTGWCLACTWHQMQVFYNEQAHPIPLETDPVLEVETLHKACKKNFLPSYFLLLALGLLMGGYFVARIFADPVGLLSSSSNLFTGFAYVCLFVISVVELTVYYCWYAKAKKAAQDGLWVDTPSTDRLQKSMMVLLAAAVILWLVNLAFADNPIYLLSTLIMLVFTVSLTVAASRIREGLKKEGFSRRANKAWTAVACVVLACVIMGGMVYFILLAGRTGLLQQDSEISADIPLSITDLADTDPEEYMAESSFNGTMLVSQQVVRQHPTYGSENFTSLPWLQYTVTEVKAPFLYDWCWDEIFRDRDETDDGDVPAGARMVYVQQDAAPWGANAVYRLCSEEGWYADWYLLCYDDCIIDISFDWELTPEQMAIVGRAFNP